MDKKISRILTLAVVALVLVGCGILSDLQGAASCNECYGFAPGLLIAPAFAIIGVVIGMIVLFRSARDAMNRRAMASGIFLIICVVLSIGALVYLYAVYIAAFNREEQQIGESFSTSAWLLQLFFFSSPIGWNIAVFVAPAAAALVYLLLRGKTKLLFGAVDGLAAFAVIAVAILVADVGGPLLSTYVTSVTPVLSAYSQSSDEIVDCTQGTFPPFTVRNAGGGTLHWTATVYPPSVKMQPSSGSLDGGGSQTVTLAGIPAGSPDHSWYSAAGIQVTFNSNGGSESQSYGCLNATTTPVTLPATPTPIIPTETPTPAALTITPSTVTGNCQTGTYPELTFADVSQEEVTWTAPAPTTAAGISLLPESDTLTAGQTEAVFITGITNSPSFTIVITYSTLTTDRTSTITIIVTCG